MKIDRRELVKAAGASLFLPLTGGMAARGQAGPVDAQISDRLEKIADELLAQWPEKALILGVDKGPRAALRSRFGDRSHAGDEARLRWYETTLAALRQIDRAGLSRDIALHVDVAEQAFALAVEGRHAMPVGDVAVLNPTANFRNSPYVVTQLGGACSDLPDVLVSNHDISDHADAEAYLARMRDYATALTSETERLLSDAARGAVPPSKVIELTASQLTNVANASSDRWEMVTSFGEKCVKAGLSSDLERQAVSIARDAVAPALHRQIAAFADLRKTSSDVPGLWARAGGEGYYRWLVKAATTTSAAPDELHALGQTQSRRIQGELDGLLKKQGLSQGSVGARLTALSTRKDLLFTNDDEGRAQLLAYLNGRIAAIRPRLPQAFHNLVAGNLVIKRVPPEIQDGAPSGYASPGSIDGSQPGMYFVNLKSTANWPRYALPTLSYHEGIPGHIWQGEYSYRLPLLRTLLSFTAYGEGWGMYAEQLADELGMYEDDPLGRIGYLQGMNFRAGRLVVDTGLHAKRWGIEEAIHWLQGATGMPIEAVTSEVYRYCAMPGQACGYKVGHNEINRLRNLSRSRLGRRYDLRDFNDLVVRTGNVPLQVLAREVERHITA